jgi:hypothetical protein
MKNSLEESSLEQMADEYKMDGCVNIYNEDRV